MTYFDADRPITKSAEDSLNRATFARYLARCLLDHQSPQSFTVGLHGAFGSGKTSILNMTIEELQSASANMQDEERPIILNFSPWSYSGHQSLTYNFFCRLASTMHDAAYLENKERIIELMDQYISYFTERKIYSKNMSAPWWKQWRHLFGRKKVAWGIGRDLTKIKSELNELLLHKKHKIVIVIDNISRVTPSEMKEMFQIVKSIGDFNHTVYLLTFSKFEVIHALKTIMPNGEELVEKVVQLSFNIPPITEQDLENILAQRLNFIFTNMPEKAWQKERWADLYYHTIKYFLKNCRDISRYVNNLNFSYNRLKEVVNPVDYFALTALEVFMPEVYAGVRDNKDLFTALLDQVFVDDETKFKREKMRCDEILARSNQHVSNDVLLSLLFSLFPRIKKLYEPDVAFYHSDLKAENTHRICSPDYFDAYFRLSMHQAHIPQLEFQTILALSAHDTDFNHAILRLIKDEKIIEFIDKLDTHVIKAISLEQGDVIIHALLDLADMFPKGCRTPLSLDTNTKVHRIVHQILLKHKFQHDRFDILKHAIKATNNSIYISVYILKAENLKQSESNDLFVPAEFRDFSADQLVELQKITAVKISDWAKSDRLMTHPDLIPILRAWIDWGEQEVARDYIKKALTEDKGIVDFLSRILDDPILQAMTRYEKNPAWALYLKEIEYYASLEIMTEHAKKIFEDSEFVKLKEKEQLAIMIFLDLIQPNTVKIFAK